MMRGDVNELFDLLRAEAEKRRKRTLVMQRALLAIAIVGFGTWLTVVLTTGRGMPDMIILIVVFLFAALAVTQYSPKHKELVTALLARKDPRIVGDLIEATYAREDDVRNMATAALPEMLGTWLSSPSQDLEPAQWGMLYGLLDVQRPIELVEAVLIVTRSLGGQESVRYLEAFAKRVKDHKETRWQRLSPKSYETMADVRMREARRIIDIGPLRDDVPLQINR